MGIVRRSPGRSARHLGRARVSGFAAATIGVVAACAWAVAGPSLYRSGLAFAQKGTVLAAVDGSPVPGLHSSNDGAPSPLRRGIALAVVLIPAGAFLGGIIGFLAGLSEAKHRARTDLAYHAIEGAVCWAVLGGALAYQAEVAGYLVGAGVMATGLSVYRVFTVAENRQGTATLAVSGVLHGLAIFPAIAVALASFRGC